MAYLNQAAGQAREGGRAAFVAAVAGTIPAGGTGAAAGGWDTAPHRDTAITSVTETITQLNAMRTSLINAGLMASS